MVVRLMFCGGGCMRFDVCVGICWDMLFVGIDGFVGVWWVWYWFFGVWCVCGIFWCIVVIWLGCSCVVILFCVLCWGDVVVVCLECVVLRIWVLFCCILVVCCLCLMELLICGSVFWLWYWDIVEFVCIVDILVDWVLLVGSCLMGCGWLLMLFWVYWLFGLLLNERFWVLFLILVWIMCDLKVILRRFIGGWWGWLFFWWLEMVLLMIFDFYYLIFLLIEIWIIVIIFELYCFCRVWWICVVVVLLCYFVCGDCSWCGFLMVYDVMCVFVMVLIG